jgi:hypothetical protein
MEAAPEAAEPQEKAEPQAEPRKRRWWRFKIPTAVIVTLVGIALTAWLLPAFTRQWDDRQKERALKAKLVADMAAASAQMVIEGEDFLASGRNAVPSGHRHSLAWSRAQLMVGARLRAYFPSGPGPFNFPSRIAADWQIYTYLVTFFDPAARSPASGSGADVLAAHVVGQQIKDDENFELAIENLRLWAPLLNRARAQNEGVYQFPNDDTTFGPTLKNTPSGYFEHQAVADFVEMNRTQKYAAYESALLSYESAIAERVLAAHPSGYSTTTRDLIHDLLPF